jgi:general secretion pathway protein H
MAQKAARAQMPMSAPANKPSARDAGFTLIEALMALLIVGLLAGAVALSAPAPDARARGAAQTLAARMTLAGDESVMRNRTIALSFTAAGYGFASLEAEGWRPLETTAALGFRPWPAGVSATVLDAPSEGQDLHAARFDVLGGATPLQVRIEGGGGVWLVRLDGEGGAHVERAR